MDISPFYYVDGAIQEQNFTLLSLYGLDTILK